MNIPFQPISVAAVALVFSTGLATVAVAVAPGSAGKADWAMVQEIERQIRRPAIPRRDYPVTDFGTVGDGRGDARPAILAAIDRASRDGGGRVVLPRGVWLSKGPIRPVACTASTPTTAATTWAVA